MSSWGVTGSSPLADLTSSIDSLMSTLLFNQWNISTPAKGDAAGAPGAITKVKFGTNWEGGVKNSYEIHCMITAQSVEPLTNDWTKYAYKTLVDIHVFARRTASALPFEDSTPLFNMIKEVQRIVVQNRLTLGQNVKPLKILGWRKADDPPNMTDSQGLGTYWHRILTVEAWHWMVDTS